MAVHDAINDIIFTKLRAHYGGTDKSLNDYLRKYQVDNPTFGTLLGTSAYYSQTSSESWNVAALRFWTAYVP